MRISDWSSDVCSSDLRFISTSAAGGTSSWRSPIDLGLALAAVDEGEALEQHHVCLVLEESAVERRDQRLDVPRTEHVERQVLVHEQLQPVEKLGRRRLLLEARNVPDLVEDGERLAHQFLLALGEVHIEYGLHPLPIRGPDI